MYWFFQNYVLFYDSLCSKGLFQIKRKNSFQKKEKFLLFSFNCCIIRIGLVILSFFSINNVSGYTFYRASRFIFFKGYNELTRTNRSFYEPNFQLKISIFPYIFDNFHFDKHFII